MFLKFKENFMPNENDIFDELYTNTIPDDWDNYFDEDGNQAEPVENLIDDNEDFLNDSPDWADIPDPLDKDFLG